MDKNENNLTLYTVCFIMNVNMEGISSDLLMKLIQVLFSDVLNKNIFKLWPGES